MERCRRVGIDVTRRCNWKCKTCFYRWKPEFNTPYDVPMEAVTREMVAAKRRGCNHALAIGWGEPMFYPHIDEFVTTAQATGLACSIITNGTASLDRYDMLYAQGLDHLHVSVHGLDRVMNDIAMRADASDRQFELMSWLKSEELPWRTNTTLQRTNLEQLSEIVRTVSEHGAFHVVLLGFLPHYEWADKLTEVAVHPAELRPQVEKCLDYLECADKLTTLRYHPFCHLDRKYWKYVTNARYVLYDPWEWEYGHCGDTDDQLWNAAVSQIGGAVAIGGSPCKDCAVQMHCGGWNATYARAFAGADLHAIPWNDELSAAARIPGYFHDQNPANKGKRP